MKILKYVLLTVALLIAFALGILLNDMPLIKFNPEFQIDEILNAFLTLLVALIVPFFVKKWIDNSHHEKTIIMEAADETIQYVNKIKLKIEECFHSKKITKEDKNLINIYFNFLDIKVAHFIKHQEIAYPKSFSDEISEIKELCKDFWKTATDDYLMSAKTVSITETFYKSHITKGLNIENKIKLLKQKMAKC